MTDAHPDDIARQASGDDPHGPTPEEHPASTSYESQLVCDFFRQIGQLETRGSLGLDAWERVQALVAGVGKLDIAALDELRALVAEAQMCRSIAKDNLVGNAQNPLDHLVGDVIGKTRLHRYFIIEFKRDVEGFAQEVTLGKAGKIDRAALMDHLAADETCRGLAARGHFGAYQQDSAIVLGPYRNLALASSNRTSAVPAFFEAMHGRDFAWNADELKQYVDCMRSHGDAFETDEGHIVFGYIDESGRVVLMVSSPRIIDMIHKAFLEANALLARQALGGGSKLPGMSGRRW